MTPSIKAFSNCKQAADILQVTVPNPTMCVKRFQISTTAPGQILVSKPTKFLSAMLQFSLICIDHQKRSILVACRMLCLQRYFTKPADIAIIYPEGAPTSHNPSN